MSISNRCQRVDTGTKCYLLAERCSNSVLSKAVILGSSFNLFRVLVDIRNGLCKSHIRCDSLLASGECVARAVPLIEVSA